MACVDRLAHCLGGALGELVRREEIHLGELRLRIGRPARLCMTDGREIEGDVTGAEELQRILARMTGDSLYACEDELREGYFTMDGGCRVGVCGRMASQDGRVLGMASIASLCIRIPREVKGCARELAAPGRPQGLLVISPPGMGKTTLLRDYARILSDGGWNVAIADERREIAACREGVPQFDVGMRTDVMDGCPKAVAMGLLIRACAPQLIVDDEIGGEGDARAILDAARCGVAVAASAHASCFAEAEERFSALIGAGAFRRAALLGDRPGNIKAVREYAGEGGRNAQGSAAFSHHDRLCGGGEDALQRQEEAAGAAG